MTRLERASSTDLEELQNFLRANSLPTVGLEDCYENFFIAIDDEGQWAGVAGYEAYKRGVRAMYLLTETAGTYFQLLDF